MVIAFGYITMFASAFPFAAFVQIVYNLIEMKSDVYKLCFVVRRPRVIRTSGIGTWQMVMQTQVSFQSLMNLLNDSGLDFAHYKSFDVHHHFGSFVALVLDVFNS